MIMVGCQLHVSKSTCPIMDAPIVIESIRSNDRYETTTIDREKNTFEPNPIN